MLRFLLPAGFLVLGVAAGVGAGIALAPGDMPLEDGAGDSAARDGETPPDRPIDRQRKADAGSGSGEISAAAAQDGGASEYFRITRPFVVPVVNDKRIAGLVTLSLSLEAASDLGDDFFAREPKLRDELLQVMFDHANSGGFDGAFTLPSNLDPLRAALTEAARQVFGAEEIRKILILEIARQDNY